MSGYEAGRRATARGVPSNLRLLNRIAVLKVLREGPSTVPYIAERAQLSPLTVSKIIQSLETEGLIRIKDLAPASPAGGKRARIWELDGQTLFAGGVMLSVSGIRVGITDYQGSLLATASSSYSATEPDKVEELTVELLQQCADSVDIEINQLVGVGVGVPALTDLEEGILVFAPHLSGWRDIPFRESLERRLGTSVLVDNEARVQALAEYYFGLGRTSNSLLCIETGVGIAAAFVVNGHIYRGDTNIAGEVGHMSIDPKGPPCRCGGRGCWETLAGTGRLVAFAREAGSKTVAEPYYDPSYAEVEEIFRAAQRGDKRARSAITDVARWLGVGIANLLNIWNPDLVVLQGDLLLGGEEFLNTVISEAQEAALYWPAAAAVIEFSKLGEDIGVIGAACLIVDHSMVS